MIKRIDIINLSHYDIGFTDHPLICRRLQAGYIDEALELVRDNASKPADLKFYWTIESNNALCDWWLKASGGKKKRLLDAIRRGWIELSAMPFNNIPLLNARQWEFVAQWLPDEIRELGGLRTIMQSDVTGMPRAGVLALMDKGAEFLWMSMNRVMAFSPMPQPCAFWWEMPDKRKIFVWNSITYPDGYYLFEKEEWRKGPLPAAADTRYRPPIKGDFFSVSPENLERAHGLCLEKIRTWQEQGYIWEYIAAPMTNMWRVDNDPPCRLLPAFIHAWNKAGLKPALGMSLPSPALSRIRAICGDSIPAVSGEWTDWWANGAASCPVELSAARTAKRNIEALESPLYGKSVKAGKAAVECLRTLCLYDEHTFGAGVSVAMPDSIIARSHFSEKSALAYRSMAVSEFTLSEENRRLAPKQKGIHLINPFGKPFAGWVALPEDCLRGKYEGVVHAAGGEELAFRSCPGPRVWKTPQNTEEFSPVDVAGVFPDNVEGSTLKFWLRNMAPFETRTMKPAKKISGADMPPIRPPPVITTDDYNFPTSAAWNGVSLFDGAVGDFFSLEFLGDFPRWKYNEILAEKSEAERGEARDKHSVVRESKPAMPASFMDTGYTLVYEQFLTHPRLRFFRRTLEIFKDMPRAQLTVTLYRTPDPRSCEVFYLRFPLAVRGWDVAVTNGGIPFIPGVGGIPGACMDYFAIDGEVIYTKADSRVTLDCLDSAMVSFGGINDCLAMSGLSGDMSNVFAAIYNNVWFTNFVGDQSGVMEFRFDLCASPIDFKGFAPTIYPVVRL